MKRWIKASTIDENSEYMDYSINDGEGYIRTYSDYADEYAADPSLQEDFASVEEYIQWLLESGDIEPFSDVSDEEYDYYFAEHPSASERVASITRNQKDLQNYSEEQVQYVQKCRDAIMKEINRQYDVDPDIERINLDGIKTDYLIGAIEDDLMTEEEFEDIFNILDALDLELSASYS